MNHVHMLVEIPPKMSVSGFVGYLKGKSSQMIFERWRMQDLSIEIDRFGVEGIL